MTTGRIDRVSAAKSATLSRGETFYPGPSRTQLAAYPPKERWDDWVELDSRAWPRRPMRPRCSATGSKPSSTSPLTQ